MRIDETGPLEPRLKSVQSDLEKNIEDVCEQPAIARIDTGELIRIEETLAIAAEEAKQAVSLRRRLHEDREEATRRDHERVRPDAREADVASPDDPPEPRGRQEPGGSTQNSRSDA